LSGNKKMLEHYQGKLPWAREDLTLEAT